ncbi:MAG: flagellar type III secretion system pore protein FliP [Rhodobacterales bacterium]|jgi:flagellar biosynthetic protein FliP
MEKSMLRRKMKCECAFESNIIGADKERRNSISSSLALLLKALIPLLFLASGSVGAQVGLPAISVSQTPDGTEYSLTLQILILMTVLTLLPSLLIMMTSFVRIIIVMSLLRQAIGTAQTPPNTVLVGISLFLTFFIMSPILNEIYDDSITPYLNAEISVERAVEVAQIPLRAFMLSQTREDDIAVFSDIAGQEYNEGDEVPLSILLPSFMTSELKTAFTIGFLIYIPFVIIDLVVASVLMSMGMMMLSPMMISMPFKLMLFVLADGWILIMQSLAGSFGV